MSAIFSPCGLYRYRLDRDLGITGPVVGFMLHNPSTAGIENDDPTSRRGIGFGRLWGARKIVYVNPWAGIATRPDDLWKMDDPIGPENDMHIAAVATEVAESGGFFVLAWGYVRPGVARQVAVNQRLKDVEAVIRATGCEVRALAVNKDGSPGHPLYLRSDTQPLAWPEGFQEP